MIPDPQSSETPVRKSGKEKVIFSATVVVLVLAYFGIEPRLVQSRKLAAQVDAVSHEVPLVSAVRLSSPSARPYLVLPSSLQAVKVTTINARTTGYVRARYVDIGSIVKAGDVLAEIDSPEMDQQVLQSAADTSHAQAGVGQARADLSRLTAAVSQANAEVVRYQANVDQAKADLAHLRAKLQQANSAVDVARAKLSQAEKRLDGARADMKRCKVEEDIAKTTMDRWVELAKSDAVSGQDVDEKQSAYRSSQARVEAAKAGVSSSEADVTAASETVKSQQSEVVAAGADIRSGSQKVQAAEAALKSSRSSVDATLAALDAARANVSAASATVGSSQASLRRYSAMQSFEHVVAPFSGVITARNIDVGDLVSAVPTGGGLSDQRTTVTKSGLFGLAQTGTLLAQANVPEDTVASVRQGQSAKIAVQEYPGRLFEGRVEHISGALDATSRTLLVEVAVPNGQGLLKPGMYAQVHFLDAKGKAPLRIPATALVTDGNGTRVAVITAGSILRYIPVKPGRDFGDEIEVLDGLTGDEVVVTDPDTSLTDGQNVRVVQDAKKQ